MSNLSKLLFKNNRPVLRKFVMPNDTNPGDLPYLWDAYQNGLLLDGDNTTMDMELFSGYIMNLLNKVQEVWMLEDFVKKEMTPVAIVLCGNDGWTLEPHVGYFQNATTRIKLRTYVAFLKKTKRRKNIGCCLMRVPQDTRLLCNRIEKMKIIQWVGRVWCGKSDGDEYIYSMRCSAPRN